MIYGKNGVCFVHHIFKILRLNNPRKQIASEPLRVIVAAPAHPPQEFPSIFPFLLPPAALEL
jgi:hypothetical protein